jgi:hypothetical protein
LLDKIKDLEADISTLHRERDAFVSEQERLQRELQQEADENANLVRERILELESEAKGDRFTSIANDAVHEELVSANEALKDQLQRQQNEPSNLNLRDAAEEIEKSHEANNKLKEIVERQKLLIEMLMDKVQRGENDSSQDSPKKTTVQDLSNVVLA